MYGNYIDGFLRVVIKFEFSVGCLVLVFELLPFGFHVEFQFIVHFVFNLVKENVVYMSCLLNLSGQGSRRGDKKSRHLAGL